MESPARTLTRAFVTGALDVFRALLADLPRHGALMTNTCHHIHDNGGTCNSAAVTGQNYCTFHLGHRARQLRMAQYRARGERFDLKLPPLESMFAVQSALNQLVEAVAADMIDLKRADFLLKALRFAAQALKSSDKWLPSVYHTDVAAPAVDLAAEYGLPQASTSTPLPKSPFLRCPPFRFVIPSGGRRFGGRSRGTCFFRHLLRPLPHAHRLPTAKTAPAVPSTPSAPTTPRRRNSSSSARSRQPRAWTRSPLATSNSSATASAATYAPTASAYAAIALENNIRLAAERLAERKLAEKEAQEKLAGCRH